MLIKNIKKNTGLSLIEVLISSAIISIALITFTTASQVSFRVVEETSKKTQAEFLAEETIEVVRILRDTSWETYIVPLTEGVVYYPVFASSTSSWLLSTTDPGLINDLFAQTITVIDVYRRDSDDDIVASTSPEQKTLDSGTKEIISRIEWDGPARIKSVYIKTYLADIFQN